jgi:hypothetical protein
MTKHDKTWVFAIWVIAIAFLLGPCFWARAVEPTVAPTCLENTIHIATAKKEIADIKVKLQSANEQEALVLGTEGEFMVKMLNMLTAWRGQHGCEI